ncbi:MAG TPA: hypothetical protein VIH76_13025 [Candidatus Acidoferrales bacterium]
MALNSFLTAADSARVRRTFRKLALHDTSRWALTGGIAIELHVLRCGGQPIVRQLHNIDFMAAAFDAIPKSLGSALLLRHVHPHDPPAKNMLQGVDQETRVRIDVFRAYGSEMERTSSIEIAGLVVNLVSLQDLVARHARLNWDLMEGKLIAPKYARDFLRLLGLVQTAGIQIAEMESIWREHRKSQSPESFTETALELRGIIASRPELLVPPVYSTNLDEVCKRCHAVESFPLASASQIFSILGYC